MIDILANPIVNMDLRKLVLGHLLTLKKADAYKFYSTLNSNWFKTSFEKNVYKVIGQLIASGDNLDLLTVMKQFRENGWADKTSAAEIASLTNDVNLLNAKIYMNSIFEELQLQESIEMAYQFRNSFDTLVQNGNMTVAKFNEILGKLQRIDFRKSKEDKSNEQVILDLLVNHDRAKNGEITGLELPYSTLSGKVLLEPVDVMVVGARPAMGKTAFAVSTACGLAKQGKRVLFFALEMSREQMMRRIVANFATVDSNAIKYGRCTSIELTRINMVTAHEYLNNVVVHDGSHTMTDIVNVVSKELSQNSVDLIVIDYLQKIIPKKSNSRYQEVTDISNQVKLLAQNFGVPIMAMAQLSRESAKTGSRPRLPDLKESGEIEQDASIVAFLHRPEYYGQHTMDDGSSSTNMTEFIVAKNREGFDGILELENYLQYSLFKDVEHSKDYF